eukprot:220414-Hanusia_phi.AAC.1
MDKESRAHEERAEAFKNLLDYAVCGLLESRLRPNEAGLVSLLGGDANVSKFNWQVFDAEERQLLVVSHNSGAGEASEANGCRSDRSRAEGFAYQRIAIEPSGVDVEWLKVLALVRCHERVKEANIQHTIHEKANEGYLFVSNTLTSITFEPAFALKVPLQPPAPAVER